SRTHNLDSFPRLRSSDLIKTDATAKELAAYIEQGGIPNQADLNFGNEGDVLHSNKPTVTPPAPTPEDPKKPEPKQPLKPKKPLRSEEHTSELQSRFDLVC